jgi:hypothetical protein
MAYRPSTIPGAGDGLFATREFEADDFIATMEEDVLSIEQWPKPITSVIILLLSITTGL